MSFALFSAEDWPFPADLVVMKVCGCIYVDVWWVWVCVTEPGRYPGDKWLRSWGSTTQATGQMSEISEKCLAENGEEKVLDAHLLPSAVFLCQSVSFLTSASVNA